MGESQVLQSVPCEITQELLSQLAANPDFKDLRIQCACGRSLKVVDADQGVVEVCKVCGPIEEVVLV